MYKRQSDKTSSIHSGIIDNSNGPYVVWSVGGRGYEYDPGNYDPNIANIDSNSEWAKQRLMPFEFTSGDISQTLQSRVDMSKYNEGCQRLTHLKPLNPVLDKSHPLSKGLVLSELFDTRCFMGGAV